MLDRVILNNEKIKIQLRLALLDEQNSIARVLGIEKIRLPNKHLLHNPHYKT